MFAGLALLLVGGAFCIQLLCCFRGKKLWIKWLPAGILVVLETAVAAGFLVCLWLERTDQGIYGGAFAAYLYSLMLLAALAGTLTAWLIWIVMKVVQKRRK